MVLDRSGNVGIGSNWDGATTVPKGKLHVDGGDVYITDDGGSPTICIGDEYTAGNYG